MKASTELAISLGSIFGFIALVLSLAFARFAFRKHRKGRSAPVDPAYEATVDQASESGVKGKKRWFGGRYGLTPIAEPGKNGTKQYLGGWFSLDSPTYAGWTASDQDGTFESGRGGSENPKTWRESHFSRASRASKRSRTGPRPSRTTELGMIEREGKDQREPLQDGRDAVEQEERQGLGEKVEKQIM
ncbi:hypothetical protein JCM16303_004393 [Sporobolomyces ruberrimus]